MSSEKKSQDIHDTRDNVPTDKNTRTKVSEIDIR